MQRTLDILAALVSDILKQRLAHYCDTQRLRKPDSPSDINSKQNIDIHP